MQSSEIVLNNLFKQARKENYQFDRLYKNFFNIDFYYKAFSRIYSNKGSGTKGTDNETADGFGEEKIKQIMDKLSNESYQPRPLRCEYIPKKNDNKRPLGIPSFTDRIIQEICRTILEAIYEPCFVKQSHGFRPDKSCHTALSSIKLEFRGVNWFLEGNIKGCFDNINHKVLISILKERIIDEKFIRLIWKFFRAGYLENWNYHKTYSGTPQGGIVSPILANIYLNELDKYIIDVISPQFNKQEPKKRKINPKYQQLTHQNRKLKIAIEGMEKGEEREELIIQYKQGKAKILTIPYYISTDENYKRIKYIRYADDFIIGICGSKQDCQEIKAKITEFLNARLCLILSEEKTLITHSSNRGRFLGYDISVQRENTITKDKNGISKLMYNWSVKLLIPKKTIEQYIKRKNMVKDLNSEKWIMLHRPELVNQSKLEIVKTYNAELRGLYNYFCLAENVSKKMWQLRYVMEYSCLKTLANKHKTSVAKIKSQYSYDKHWGIAYETKKGNKIAYFYRDGFKVKHCIENSSVDIIPNTYIYIYILTERN